MATIQRSTTKVANRLMSYAEKRADIREGVHAPADYAKAQFKATRELWGKNDGIQAHHIVQSFQPNEITPEQANQIGQELTRKIAPGHEAVVYTHTDKDHIHNHIAINSVNFENGKKYHAHGKEELYKIRAASDELCKERQLSIVREHTAGVRYTLAEKQLLEKGKTSWKDEIREAVDLAKDNSTDFHSFQEHLRSQYGVEAKLRGQTLSYKHPDRQRYVRANKLGANYEKEALEHGFEREVARGKEYERTLGGDERVKSADDQLYSGADERGNRQRPDDTKSARANQRKQQRHHSEYAISLGQARTNYQEKQKGLARGFDRWTKANTGKQQTDDKQIEQTGREERQPIKQHQREHEYKHEQNRERHQKSRKRSKGREQGHSL